MSSLERVTVVMTLMEQLRAVMAEENALVRQMKLDRLNDLHAEKAALADAYELELRRLRGEPELFVELSDDVREHLQETTRNFQEASKYNAQVLMAARTLVERMMRKLGESMAVTAPRAGGYGQQPGKESLTSGQVISVAFNREL
jgi:hypothetical protein